MFYIKAVTSNGNILVCDTDDNSCEEYRNRDLTKIIESKILGCRIYGCFVYNHRCECVSLHPNQEFSRSELETLCKKHREQHNPWSKYPIDDYLAMLKVGTKFEVRYTNTDSSGYPFTGVSKFTKLDVDKWKFEDENNTFDGEVGNSEYAAHFVDVASCYSRTWLLK